MSNLFSGLHHQSKKIFWQNSKKKKIRCGWTAEKEERKQAEEINREKRQSRNTYPQEHGSDGDEYESISDVVNT